MVKNIVNTVLNTAGSTVSYTEQEIDTISKPVRKGVLKRFPIIFRLFSTFGVVAIFVGFERIISDIPVLNNHPVIVLLVGVFALMCTGTLYTKL